MRNKHVQMEPTVRDTGYAWVIVVAAFFLQAIQDGVRFSYGLFFVEFLEEFNKGKGQTAWVGSIMLSVFNLGGPFSAYIVNRFGYRVGTMTGALITTVGFLLSYFTPNLYYLFLTFGALQGFGFGMVFLSGYVATGKYFKKRRALAVGITFCGGGMGTFIFLPVARVIIDTYGWRGSMFILAGVTLNECVCASLLRPFIEGDSETDEAEKEDLKNNQQPQTGKEHCNNSKQDIKDDRFKESDGNVEEEQGIPLLAISTDIYFEHEKSVAVTNNEHETYSRSPVEPSDNDTSMSLAHDVDKCSIENVEVYIETMAKKNDETKNDKFKNTFIENVFPKELVTNINFIILMLSTVFIAIPEFVPYSMLPDFALDVKCSSSQSAWMLSAVGIGATISQVSAGWLADLKCVHNLSLLGGCILSIGVTTMIVAVIPMFETLITYSVMFGMLSGAMYSVQPIVLLEYIDEKHMATLQGLTMWVYGISGLIGSPAAGWLFDATGNYTLSFLAAGACFMVSGSMNFLVLVTKRSREARKLKKMKSES